MTERVADIFRTILPRLTPRRTPNGSDRAHRTLTHLYGSEIPKNINKTHNYNSNVIKPLKTRPLCQGFSQNLRFRRSILKAQMPEETLIQYRSIACCLANRTLYKALALQALLLYIDRTGQLLTCCATHDRCRHTVTARPVR